MTKKDMYIYLLFSVENNYDQPPNNLKCIWKEKPTIEQVAKAINQSFPSDSDKTTLNLVNLWNGKEVRINN